MKLPPIKAKVKEINPVTIQVTCPNCGYTDYYNNPTRYRKDFARHRFYPIRCRRCGADFTYDRKLHKLVFGGRRVA